VSTSSSELNSRCARCSYPLALDALECEHCHALTHAPQLEALAAEAKSLEAQGDFSHAREKWLAALRWLPPASTQAEWIKQHIQNQPAAEQYAPGGNERIQMLGLSGPDVTSGARVEAARNNSFRWTAVVSFVAFVAIYSAASGLNFGVGFAVLILLHEMGHFIDIKRRGLPADMPVFLPGLGAYVRWEALGVPLETRAAISLAGPFAGFLASVGCAVIWQQTRLPLWADLARVGAILNLLNLIPVWVLDGGHAALALSKPERVGLLVASAVLWFLTRDNMLLLVAAGAAYRAFFVNDLPAKSSPKITAYYIAVLTALTLMIWLLPGRGLGIG
jgi:Zn-dependent protease